MTERRVQAIRLFDSSYAGEPTHSTSHDLIGKAWHPKITPYRLAVLTTTVGLGTAKAVVSQNGGTIVSITLEWLVGSLLSVMYADPYS